MKQFRLILFQNQHFTFPLSYQAMIRHHLSRGSKKVSLSFLFGVSPSYPCSRYGNLFSVLNSCRLSLPNLLGWQISLNMIISDPALIIPSDLSSVHFCIGFTSIDVFSSLYPFLHCFTSYYLFITVVILLMAEIINVEETHHPLNSVHAEFVFQS